MPMNGVCQPRWGIDRCPAPLPVKLASRGLFPPAANHAISDHVRDHLRRSTEAQCFRISVHHSTVSTAAKPFEPILVCLLSVASRLTRKSSLCAHVRLYACTPVTGRRSGCVHELGVERMSLHALLQVAYQATITTPAVTSHSGDVRWPDVTCCQYIRGHWVPVSGHDKKVRGRLTRHCAFGVLRSDAPVRNLTCPPMHRTSDNGSALSRTRHPAFHVGTVSV